MNRNHICEKCGGIAGWDPYFQSWICTRCGNMEPKPITNYDRIISATPEKLAKALAELSERCPDGVDCDSLPPGSKCYECWLHWLEEKVSE